MRSWAQLQKVQTILGNCWRLVEPPQDTGKPLDVFRSRPRPARHQNLDLRTQLCVWPIRARLRCGQGAVQLYRDLRRDGKVFAGLQKRQLALVGRAMLASVVLLSRRFVQRAAQV